MHSLLFKALCFIHTRLGHSFADLQGGRCGHVRSAAIVHTSWTGIPWVRTAQMHTITTAELDVALHAQLQHMLQTVAHTKYGTPVACPPQSREAPHQSVARAQERLSGGQVCGPNVNTCSARRTSEDDFADAYTFVTLWNTFCKLASASSSRKHQEKSFTEQTLRC
jgi:hypothetical protein